MRFWKLKQGMNQQDRENEIDYHLKKYNKQGDVINSISELKRIIRMKRILAKMEKHYVEAPTSLIANLRDINYATNKLQFIYQGSYGKRLRTARRDLSHCEIIKLVSSRQG